ncbi:MAG: NADH-quinone oxidoreductase subunit A, partial [Planctomycetes bacterium]|nr:NADH-quinone oxidoreductase subunit A [Planctomycetota bacterium]
MEEGVRADSLGALALYAGAVVALVAAMVGLSWVLGERHRERATGQPYESGILPTGSARPRLSAKFYLVAMFFVVFDVEAVFIVAWAAAAVDLGWTGYVELLVFVGILGAILA